MVIYSAKEQIAVLRRWSRVLAFSFLGSKADPKVTWEEFCDAQDKYEELLSNLQEQVKNTKKQK